ncbi:MAG: response regulator [Chloroflexaceae bacterium]|nr:response regulator [Chloroflexaceae bacterium]
MDYRVLVVSSEQDPLRSLSGQITGAAMQVIESANEVLWEVNANPPQIILASTHMPDMSGLELADILSGFGLPTRLVLWNPQPDEALQIQVEALGAVFVAGEPTPDRISSAFQQALTRYAEHEVQAAAAVVDVEPEPEPEPTSRAARAAAARAEKPKTDELPEPSVASHSDKPGTSELGERASSRTTRLSARVTERSADTPKPAPSRPSISERAAEKAATTPHHESIGRRASGNMVVTAENLTPIRSVMSDLSQELGPQCIMLTDRAGMVLVEVGTTDNLPTMILLPLLSTSFSTAGEIARQLREKDATTLYIHEGHNYDLYCFDISQRFLLTLVFNKAVANSRIGAVWVNTRRAIRELQDALS